MLRGINVGGHKMIKMPELIALYESLGFKHIVTYVQSGNVIFEGPDKDIDEIPSLIEEKIKREFDMKVPVLLRTQDEMGQIIKNNPFVKERGIDLGKLHITFLSAAPTESARNKTVGVESGPDRFVVVNNEVYLYCPEGYGRTKLSNNFFEKKLGVAATTRNWQTVNALLQIAKNQPH